jgi:hypothetical protein
MKCSRYIASGAFAIVHIVRPSWIARSGMTNGQPELVNAFVSDAFMNRPNAITDNIIHMVSDRRAGINVAAQLVYDHTPSTGSRRVTVSAAPRHVMCSSQWCDSRETANTKTKSKKSSRGVTSEFSPGSRCEGGRSDAALMDIGIPA